MTLGKVTEVSQGRFKWGPAQCEEKRSMESGKRFQAPEMVRAKALGLRCSGRGGRAHLLRK